MGMITRRRAAIAGASAVALLAILWLAAPFVLRAAVDRGLRDLGRHQDLVGTRGAIRHAGTGFALHDLAITTREGAVLLTLRRARVSPALAWPPARLELDGLHVTADGLSQYTRTFESSGRSWYRNAKSGIDRQNRNLHGATPTIHLRDATIDRPTGTIHIPTATASWSAPTPSRATLTVHGTATLTSTTVPASVPVPDPAAVPDPDAVPVPVPNPSPAPASATLSLDVTQDAVTLHLSVSLSPTDSPSPSISLASRRSPAPGWSTITSNEATWTGEPTASNELAKRLLGW